jgi:acyl-CoA dehydrogenase
MTFENLTLEQSERSPARTVTEADIVAFAGLSGDYNPLHTDAEFAATTAFGRPIAHGLLVAAIASGLFTRTDLSRRLQSGLIAMLGIDCRFHAPVFAGDTVAVTATISELRPTKREDRGVAVITRELHNQRAELVQTAVTPLLIARGAVRHDEERELQRSVRGVLESRFASLITEHEQARTFPLELLPELHEYGYVRGLLPVADGGDAMSYAMHALLMEEAGRCWGSLRTTLNILTVVPILLSSVGSPEQKQRFLAPLVAGERRGWFAMTEPEAGSDAAALRTTAERDGDHYILNGLKLYITNASYGEVGIVLATIDRSAGARGITAFVVDTRESDVEINEIPHMPVRSASSCEVVFSDTRVPAANMLGEPGRGLAAAMAAINVGRLSMAMGAVGISQAALELSVAFARTREQFGKPLGGFQLVQEMIVEIATLTQTARLLGMNAARTLDAGLDARMECSMAKYYCGEAVNKAVSLALQVHGGAGLMEESPIERLFRDAREATIPEGTSQIQILQMGKQLLGLSAMR